MPEIVMDIDRLIPDQTERPETSLGVDWTAIGVGAGFVVGRDQYLTARVAASRYGKRLKRRFRVLARGDKVYVVRKR